jgi:class 3 adenylate cyclase
MADPQEQLRAWAEHFHRLEWSVALLDDEWRLQWVSPELKQFIRETDDHALGVGLHLAEAWTRDVWTRTASAESQIEIFTQLAPFFISEFQRRGIDPRTMISEPFVGLLPGIEPAEVPLVWSGSFVYVDPEQPELPSYTVNMCFLRLHDESGALIGWVLIFFMGIRPNLAALLVRGDENMHERMARLIEPSARQAAILFCDLHRSGRLSRQLSSITYFKLVRQLWTGMDAVIAEECGIVGKHAGDGASAYFLVDDVGSPSAAARAAVRAARRIHEISHDVFSEVLESPCQMKVGLHWGGSLYMGQLVPGGRLDVTALGDEVNEAARIQECAQAHETLISKQLVEQLTSEHSASLGFDLEKLTYKTIAELPDVPEKVVRDAGGIPVTSV